MQKQSTRKQPIRHIVYGRWASMIRRCRVPEDAAYHNYGGRGITVCPEWQNSKTFCEWWDSAFSAYDGDKTQRLCVDRIDNNGPYSPDNCRLATYKINANNKRTNRMLTHDGKTLTMSQMAEEIGISYKILNGRMYNGVKDFANPKRVWPKVSFEGEELSLKEFSERIGLGSAPINRKLNLGWTPEQVAEYSKTRVRSRPRIYTWNGVTQCIERWAKVTGIPANVLRNRLVRYGYSPERAFTTPIGRNLWKQ